MIKVSGLFIYPVKSLGGISVSQAELGPRGLKYDREWVIVDNNNNRFITQREIARTALIQTAIDEDNGCLVLRLPKGRAGTRTSIAGAGDSGEKFETLSIPLLEQSQTAETIKVTVWSDSARATIESASTNAALSKYLGQDVRLVRMAPGYKRRVDGRYAPSKDDIVGFADGFPLLVISDESLEDLNNRLEYPVLMNRFRPNLTISGGGAFVEDTLSKVMVKGIELDLVKPCARCVITTIDQETGDQGKEPLRTLAGFRKKNGKILFGQNGIFRGTGTLTVGAEVAVCEARPLL